MQAYQDQQHSDFPLMRNRCCCPFCNLRRLMCGGFKPCMPLRKPCEPSCFTKPCVPLCKPHVPCHARYPKIPCRKPCAHFSPPACPPYPWPCLMPTAKESARESSEMLVTQPPAQKQMIPQQAQPQQTVSISEKTAKNNSAEIWSQLIDALRLQAQQEQGVPKPIVQGQFAERLEQLRSAMQARLNQAPAVETSKPPEEPLFNHAPALEIAEPPIEQLVSHMPPQREPADNAAWGSPVNDAELSAIKAYEAL